MPNTRTHTPRGALVFDMRLLGRQAGSSLTQKRTVPAPDNLRLELIGVPEGADVALEVRFEAVSEGVLATGTATAPLAGECARCLAPLTSSVTAGFQELYLYADGRHEKHDRHDKHEKYDSEMLGQVTSHYGNVRIERFHGLLVDFCAANGITAVIKGLRRQ